MKEDKAPGQISQLLLLVMVVFTLGGLSGVMAATVKNDKARDRNHELHLKIIEKCDPVTNLWYQTSAGEWRQAWSCPQIFELRGEDWYE